MKPETSDWLRKGEDDWKVAVRESQSADPVYDAVCFHAQQCAEKHLKAVLEEEGITFPRIHDLVVLVDCAAGVAPELGRLRTPLAALTAFGTAYRYPGADADATDARDALSAAEDLRAVVRSRFGLS